LLKNVGHLLKSQAFQFPGRGAAGFYIAFMSLVVRVKHLGVLLPFGRPPGRFFYLGLLRKPIVFSANPPSDIERHLDHMDSICGLIQFVGIEIFTGRRSQKLGQAIPERIFPNQGNGANPGIDSSFAAPDRIGKSRGLLSKSQTFNRFKGELGRA